MVSAYNMSSKQDSQCAGLSASEPVGWAVLMDRIAMRAGQQRGR